MDRKIRVLHITECFAGGVLSYLSQLCNDLCGEFDTYLAFSTRPQTPADYKTLVDDRVHMIEVPDFGKGITDIANDISVIKRLREIEKQVQPDIIHLHSSIAGGLGRLAFKGKDNTVIYTPHGYAHIALDSGMKRKMYKAFEYFLGKTNSMTLTCCESEDEEARKFCKRTAYIETGINLEDLSASLDGVQPAKNKKFTVFSLGRITSQKQPELFNRVAELVPEARFIWIGEGELRDLLSVPNIAITGWKPRKEALAIAKGADVFVLCSRAEAIAMSLLENMYMKKLCLVSNVIGNKSVIHDGKNGYVCETAEEYARRIREAMINFPNGLVEEAYREIRTTYNTNVMKEKFISFYKSLVLQGRI